MKRSFSTIFILICVLHGKGISGLNGPAQRMVIITDQSLNRIIIVNTATKKITREWRPPDGGIRPNDENWFGAPSDAKAVYNGNYILMTASKGAVALIRMKDKKAGGGLMKYQMKMEKLFLNRRV